MTITADSPWRELGKVSYDQWMNELWTVASPITDEGRDAYDAAGAHSALCLGMLWVESKHATAFNRNVPANLNPLNLRPPGQDGYMSFRSYADGIRAWVERITSPTYRDGIYARTGTIRELVGVYAPGFDNNNPDEYAQHIVNRHRAIFGVKENAADDTSDGASQGDISNVSTPATIDYSPLPVPVIIDLIGEDQPNQNPGIAMNPTSGTWHETANYANGADALMHQKWINAGAGGTQTSWHFTVDDKRIVQHIPLNRVAWHAGDGAGPGNYTSVAVECCTNADGDLAKAQDNTAALFGLLIAKGIIGTVWQHNHWSGKDCPRLLRQGKTMTWPQAAALVAKYYGQYKPPADPQPAPIWWEPGEDVGIVTRESDGYKANAMLVQTYATTKRDVPVYDQIGGKKIAEVAAGKPAIIGGTTRARDAKATGWYFVKVDGGYGRARASSFLDKLPMP